MKFTMGISIVIIIFSSIFGCSPKSSDLLVLEVGQQKISLAEYENFYTRNSGGWEMGQKSSIEERERFLDLLTNYKLKLQYAYDHNLLNDPEIINELREYRATLATTFLIEREITDQGVRRLYDRRREEIRAQHILIKITPDAKPEDTLQAYSKTIDLLKRLQAGERFDSLALQYSEDPSAKYNSGDIYYFTGGQMVTPFENAAFNMKKGELLSYPVRSAFGYHIIKILDRQPARGSIKVSHIMTRFQKSAADSADTSAALSRIIDLQDSIKKGWDFHKLSVKLSEDAGSAPQGGDLGWFERRRFVQPFDEAAFKLSPGQISPVIRTPFGYHLIKCDSAKPFPSYKELREDIKKVYQQQRYNEDYNQYIANLKKDFGFILDETVLSSFISALDTTKTTEDSAWSATVPTDLRYKPLMTLNHKGITLDTVISILENKPEYQNTPLRENELKTKLKKITEIILLEEKTIGMEQRSAEFSSLMKEYTDGILLYKAEQMEVWNKTSVTDSSLREYFKLHSDDFKFPDRVNLIALIFETDTTAFLVYDSLKNGADFAEAQKKYHENPAPRSTDGSRGLQSVETDEITKHARTLQMGDLSEPFALEDGSYTIVKVVGKDDSRLKTYEEAGAEVSNAYQEFLSKQLEKQWLDSIKSRYPVKQYKETLVKAFTNPPQDK
ncbi:MAG: peptidylprolyl isomerase [Ignavibacteriales bacterium]|nr:peptidylprolyl isomerase [Ignavibacteriales bacterium]